MNDKSLPSQEDRELMQLRASWQSQLDGAEALLDAAEPPADLFAKIEARIQREDKERPTRTIRSGSGAWLELEPGVHKKLLYVDADAGWQAYLVKIEPGARVDKHFHDTLEECLVLHGEIEIDGEIVREGDLHLAYPGFFHSELFSRTGTTLYVRGQI